MPRLKIRKRNKKYQKRKTWKGNKKKNKKYQKRKISKSNNEYQKIKLRKKSKTSSCITYGRYV